MDNFIQNQDSAAFNNSTKKPNTLKILHALQKHVSMLIEQKHLNINYTVFANNSMTNSTSAKINIEEFNNSEIDFNNSIIAIIDQALNDLYNQPEHYLNADDRQNIYNNYDYQENKENENNLKLSIDRKYYRQMMINELLGLGPLEELLQNDSITEIMVNNYKETYIECNGVITRHSLCFNSEQTLRNIVERIVTRIGRRIDESSPIVDARLADGSRAHIILPPLALNGIALTIRKFPKNFINTKSIALNGMIKIEQLDYLSKAVGERKNILIIGGTGSGKTTLLNLLSEYIEDNSRIITIEDLAELKLRNKHVLRLEARPANSEGKGEISIRELLRNALRMRPDRIIIGECRGAEALDMLQAMNTGHSGSLTTLHANSALDALSRLETMVMMARLPLSLAAIRSQIVSAINIVIQVKRNQFGKRMVSEIYELDGLQNGEFLTQCKFSEKDFFNF